MRGAGRPLRTRIVITTALVSAIAMAAMVSTVVLVLNAITHKSVDTSLSEQLSVIASAIENSDAGPEGALEVPDDSIDDTTWLYDQDGAKLIGPRVKARTQAVADELGQVHHRTRVLRHERVFLAAPVQIGGPQRGTGVLVVSRSLEPYEETRTQIIVGLVLLGLLVTAGATGIAAWTVGRTLAPVEDMAALAEDWSERALDARFEDPGTGDEIAHLARTLNLLLDRVAGALRGEQLLTSELAHELRTPLTGIRGEAELALMKAPPDGPEVENLQQVVALAEKMGTTIAALLDIARGGEHSGTRTTVQEVVTAVLESHAGSNGRVLEDVGPPDRTVALAATTELAARAMAPLVDNALRHASSRVTISASVADRTASIHVSDDGPGLVGDPENLFGAGTRDDSSPGAGLGLALARRVAKTLGGQVHVTSVTDPTTFTLTLPRS
jgi:two-component system OmpR family sensor kinase